MGRERWCVGKLLYRLPKMTGLIDILVRRVDGRRRGVDAGISLDPPARGYRKLPVSAGRKT